ncbi:hypothetical protein C5S29_00420, partial [ANME-1 cluster archaeon GoMg3.2]|nr:hypothetical protein [ANME-1 cluster archaeon GoMg3.2]
LSYFPKYISKNHLLLSNYYLVDTDWIIHGLHGKEKEVTKLLELKKEGLAISVISLAELYEGVYGSADPVSNERVLKDFLTGVTVLEINEFERVENLKILRA